MGVGVVVGVVPLPSDKVHDLVLALTRAVGIRENHLDVLPARVIVQPVVDVVAQALDIYREAGKKEGHILVT